MNNQSRFGTAPQGVRGKLTHVYERHEHKLTLAFFVGGFLFDVLMLSDIDDPISLVQQVFYLVLLAGILWFDFIFGPDSTTEKGPAWWKKAWSYRSLAFHFSLGSLLNLYSLFFLKSASFFSSMAFVLVLLVLIVANELKSVQASGVNIKMALFVICLFCFFSMMVPLVLGFVGIFPFFLALALTGLCLWLMFRQLQKRVATVTLRSRLALPAGFVLGLFTVFYAIGWIPPVPLSIEKMGIYHKIERRGEAYVLHEERPWWKFWLLGDQDFLAEPGDKLNLFVSVFSPARFEDTVTLHWLQWNERQGWMTTDRIPMRVVGGRRSGFRGTAIKQNFTPGQWRVSVETNDGRELGRLYFDVERTEQTNPGRVFREIEYL
jgi:hypothetical protein